MSDLLDDFTGMLPDWAQNILNADPVTAFAGAGATALGNQLFGGSKPMNQPLTFTGGGFSPAPSAPASSSPIQPLFGANGILFATQPNTPALPGGGGGAGGGAAIPSSTGGMITYASIRAKMSGHLGFKPRRKTVLYLIRTLGFAIASAVLGLDINDVLWLFTHRRHGSRRHYVQTMLKTIRRAEGYRHQLGRVKVPHSRRRSSSPARGKTVTFRAKR